MTDIVERLREVALVWRAEEMGELVSEAADEIERLRERLGAEQNRCASICNGMALAIEIGAGNSAGWSEDQRAVAMVVARWLRDEIKGVNSE